MRSRSSQVSHSHGKGQCTFFFLFFFLRQILEIAFILSKGGYLVFDKYFLILIYGWAEEEGVGRREDKDKETIGLDKMYM